MAQKRLYVVRFAPKGTESVRYLVNARSPAGALRTAVMFLGGEARYAEQSDIYQMATAGEQIIEEGDQPQGELPIE